MGRAIVSLLGPRVTHVARQRVQIGIACFVVSQPAPAGHPPTLPPPTGREKMRAMTVHLDDDSRTDEALALQTTVFETDAQLKKHLDRTPASIKQLIVRFGIGAIAALTLVSVFTAFASRRVGTQQAIDDARNATLYIAKGIVETNASDGLFSNDRATREAAIEQLDTPIRSAVLRGSLVRVKLWAPDGTIIYSDRRALIGQKFGLDEDKEEMFANSDP